MVEVKRVDDIRPPYRHNASPPRFPEIQFDVSDLGGVLAGSSPRFSSNKVAAKRGGLLPKAKLRDIRPAAPRSGS